MSEPYRNEAQQRLLQLVQLLAGNELTGIAPAEIARQLKVTPSCITRDVANLQMAGMAELVPETGRVRLGPALVQMALKHMAAMDRAQSRLNEIKARYSRT